MSYTCPIHLIVINLVPSNYFVESVLQKGHYNLFLHPFISFRLGAYILSCAPF